MAKHKFQKGNQYAKGNQIAPQFYEGRKLTKMLYEEILHKYMHKNLNELRAIIANPGETPSIDMMVISILAKCISQGDPNRAEFLLSRLVAKVPQQVQVEDVTDKERIKSMADELLKVAQKPK